MINQETLEQIEDCKLKSEVLKKENIPILEEILNKEIEEYKKLKRLNEEGKLNFGKKLKNKELQKTFVDIKKEVDEFLQVQNIESPEIGYYNIFQFRKTNLKYAGVYAALASILTPAAYYAITNFNPIAIFGTIAGTMIAKGIIEYHKEEYNISTYSPLEETIDLSKKDANKTNNIVISAHEYTHHILSKKGILQATVNTYGTSYESFSEGISRGVERHISKVWSEKEDNPSYRYNALNRGLYELKKTYEWTCHKLGVKRNKALLKTKTTTDEDVDKAVNVLIKENMAIETIITRLRKTKEAGSYDIGNTYFTIQEAKYGAEIYAQAVKRLE